MSGDAALGLPRVMDLIEPEEASDSLADVRTTSNHTVQLHLLFGLFFSV